MKTYRVKFYFETDLRTEEIVESSNEGFALIQALEKSGGDCWVDAPGFRIEIELYTVNKP